MKSVIIYTQNDCPPCTFIKSYLTDKGVAFEEKMLRMHNIEMK